MNERTGWARRRHWTYAYDMASQSSYIEHLAKIPLFTSLSRKELALLAKLCDEVTVRAGKVLVKQGTVGYECFVIVEGEALVERDGRGITNLGAGAYFGELALLDKGPRSATVTAATDMTVLVMGPREFTSALDAIPNLSQKLLASLARRIRETDAKFVGH
jgi:CRP/FNR family transcriptional regulator, cyclic AMP receptor protein